MPLGLDVERHNLRRTAEVLRRAGVAHFLVPTDARTSARLGIAADDLSSALAALTAPTSGVAVTAEDQDRRWALSAGSDARGVKEGAVLLVHSLDSADPLPHFTLQARPCVVEPWWRSGTSHRATLPNMHASAVDLGRATWSTISAIGVDGLPTVTDFCAADVSSIDFPVDAVMLWVDGADPEWQARREEVQFGQTGLHSGAIDPARFRDHGELRYALRSLELYAPWIRKVFLVTDRQRPSWLSADQERVVVVDHTEIFGSHGTLPTFNSHAISARIHHIPGLAEHFVYLNDDVFIGRPVKPEQWFDSTGATLFHTTRSRVQGPSVQDPDPPTMARRRVADLVERDFGRRPHEIFQHGPHALRRSTLLMLEERYSQELAATWAHQFRSADDLEIVWLHNYVGYFTGLARPSSGVTVKYTYLSLGLSTTANELSELLRRRHKDVFCINDEGVRDLAPEAVGALGNFLGSYFPTSATFEDPALTQSLS